MTFPVRTLGKNGSQVNAVGLGLMSLGSMYGSAGSLDEKVAFLDHAHATGQRFWDTADMYLDSEDVVGEWIKRNPSKRDDIFLATKFGIQYTPGSPHTIRSDPEYVKEACEKSLKRLGVETIDLYYCHRVDGVTPVEKTIEAMVELKRQGKIRYLGISEASSTTLRRAHAVHPISAQQIEYSAFALDIESSTNDVLKTCRELGVTVVAYSPIGRGVLTGQIQSLDDIPEDDFRRWLPKYSKENFPKIVELAQGFQNVAKAHGCTAGQVAIAWLLAQGLDIIPLPGTKSIGRMDENANSALVELTDKEVQDLRDLAERSEISGGRYAASMVNFTLSETPPL